MARHNLGAGALPIFLIQWLNGTFPVSFLIKQRNLKKIAGEFKV
jgi:hypothetical protein